jgi:hypothetical protein
MRLKAKELKIIIAYCYVIIKSNIKSTSSYGRFNLYKKIKDAKKGATLEGI